MSDPGKKRKKRYFIQHAKKRKTAEAGMRGFLGTCNGNLKDCIKEAYNILNEFGDTLYGTEKAENSTEPSHVKEIEEDLDDELKKLKEEETERRFQALDTGVPGSIFIKAKVEDPLALSLAIMKDISESKKARTKSLIRLLPIQVVCKAYLDDLKRAAEKLFKTIFQGEATTFAIRFNRRQNDKLDRVEVIQALGTLVKDRNPLHKADLKSPKQTILVEVIKNICFLSVVPEYMEYAKYNLLEITKVDDKTTISV